MSARKNKTIKLNTFQYDNFDVEQVCLESHPEITYEIARRNKSVIMIPKFRDKLLMIYEYRIAVNQTLLQFPAGKIENLEQPELAASRELREETGFDFESIEYVGSFYSAPQFTDEEFFIYSGEVINVGAQKLTNREKIEVSFVYIKDVEKMISNNLIKDAKTISAYVLWRSRNVEI